MPWRKGGGGGGGGPPCPNARSAPVAIVTAAVAGELCVSAVLFTTVVSL